MNRPIILLNYARSGGTLLNRLFGSLPNTVVLSEVNQLGCAFDLKGKKLSTVKKQLADFYNIKIESDEFVSAIEEINQYCILNKKQLIIRDWTYIEYNYNEYYKTFPRNELTTIDLLSHLNPIVFALVRDSIDVWISRGYPKPNEFYAPYLKYLEDLKQQNIKIFKYEDLTSRPSETFKNICDHCKIAYVDVTKSFSEFKKVNGDINKVHNSRGFDLKEIKKLERKAIPLSKIKEINESSQMRLANKWFNYSCRYHISKLDHYKFKILN